MRTQEKDRLIDAVLQKNRIEMLKAMAKPIHVSALARKTHLTRATVCYHLTILQNVDLVEQEYVLLKEPSGSKGRVGNFYRVNRERLREAFKIIDDLLTKARTGLG
ncbi:MAG: helix-turn-helix domain-containing protein [Candidatus Bathyarchaeota archaeon]|nr:helix-turn-helix domain-containing protein [Candidatus Bathyarchaeota archaeon]